VSTPADGYENLQKAKAQDTLFADIATYQRALGQLNWLVRGTKAGSSLRRAQIEPILSPAICTTLGWGPPGIQVPQLLEASEVVLRRRPTEVALKLLR
jgi:hypothetical protein